MLATRSIVRATLVISGAAVIIEPSTVRSSPTLLSSRRFSPSMRVELEGAADDQAELVDVDRLLVEIIGARRDRPERAFAGAVAGGDDHLGLGLQRQDRLERGEALGDAVGIGRQAEVERHHRRLGRADEVERGVAVGGDQHLIIVIGPAQLALQPLIVLDDQQLGLDVERSCAHPFIMKAAAVFARPADRG